jgi:hypothetical protein
MIDVDDRLEEASRLVRSQLASLPVRPPAEVARRHRRSRIRIAALTTVATLAVVLVVSTVPLGGGRNPATTSTPNRGVVAEAPENEDRADPIVSGLGMDGTYFALDDPSWTLIQARTTTEGGQGTLSQYERGDQGVAIYTGGAATGLLEQSPTDPGTTLQLNSNQVTERSYSEGVSFNWTTSDGLAVVVEFDQMNRNQALEVATALQPVDTEAWEQLTAAAVSDLQARTGKFGTGGEEGFGEWIRLDAPDALEVILELAEGIKLPPRQTFDRMIENLPDEPTEQTEDGIKSTLEFEAGCIWTGYWLDAVEADDTDARDEAVAVLEEIPTWPALNASDGRGIIDAWTRNAELAAAGDVQGVLDNLYTNNCTDIVPGQ